MVRERPAARSPSVQACGSGLRRSSRRPDFRSTKARASAPQRSGGRIEHGHGRAPLVSDLALRTSFQSPPSIGGRSRANGILNFSPSDRWRSAKRSPGPLASAALQRSAPGSIAILASSASSAAIVPGAHAAARRGIERVPAQALDGRDAQRVDRRLGENQPAEEADPFGGRRKSDLAPPVSEPL